MKLITTTALAVVAAAFATPVAAQDYQNSYSQPRQQQSSAQSSSGQSTAQQPAVSIKPSSKASKAIFDLQTAVNAKDNANIPAKVAAAQAVATTKEDHYLIARLQLTAALANKDTAAMESAIDAIAATNYLDSAKMAGLYSSIGGAFLNAKQFPQAADAFQKSVAFDPRNADVVYSLGQSLYLVGQKAAAATPLEE